MHDTEMDMRRRSDSHYMRKIKKPIIEKRRRDRINSSLSQLKDILLQHIKQYGGVPTSRLDKADILELTVRFLNSQTTTEAIYKTQDRAGFRDCAKETFRYIGDACAVPDYVTSRLHGHLLQSDGIRCAKLDNIEGTQIPHHQPLIIKIPNVHVPTPVFKTTGSSGVEKNLLMPVNCSYRAYNEQSAHAQPEQMSPDSGVDTDSFSKQDGGSDSDISVCGSSDTDVWRPW